MKETTGCLFKHSGACYLVELIFKEIIGVTDTFYYRGLEEPLCRCME